jgi:hypothetical protein
MGLSEIEVLVTVQRLRHKEAKGMAPAKGTKVIIKKGNANRIKRDLVVIGCRTCASDILLEVSGTLMNLRVHVCQSNRMALNVQQTEPNTYVHVRIHMVRVSGRSDSWFLAALHFANKFYRTSKVFT